MNPLGLSAVGEHAQKVRFGSVELLGPRSGRNFSIRRAHRITSLIQLKFDALSFECLGLSDV